MAEKRQPGRAVDLLGALIQSGNRLVRRRPLDLAHFLGALDESPAIELLATNDGQRAAYLHLGHTWDQTVAELARPDSLPAVVERRSRLRVNPLAPWLTAGVAAAGSAAVISADQPTALGVAGVVGVASMTALGAGWLWRPRPARADRRFTLTGGTALAARAQALAGQPTTGDPEALRVVDRLVAAAHGCARDVEAAERAARSADLIDAEDRLLADRQLSPAHRALVEDVLTQRAELVRCLLHLQHAVLRLDEEDRQVRRAEYRRIVGDLDD